MDYGKFKYQEQKKAHEAKLKQKIIQVKEIKFRPGTDEGDYSIKVRNLIRFLEEGDKVKVVIQFKAREITHPELARKLMDKFIVNITEHAVIEKPPSIEGKMMTMILSPKP